jgi:hypothetical protein
MAANQGSAQPVWMVEKFGRGPTLLTQAAAIRRKIPFLYRPGTLCFGVQMHTALK